MVPRKKHRSEQGRTMIEMIAVLGIMGLISAAAMVWWARAIDTQKANAIMEEVLKRTSLAQVQPQETASGEKRPRTFVTDLYSNSVDKYQKLNYGYGVSKVLQYSKSQMAIAIGAVNNGDPIPDSVCTMLVSRAQTDQIQTVEWKFLKGNWPKESTQLKGVLVDGLCGRDVNDSDKSDANNNTMVALVSLSGRIESNLVAPPAPAPGGGGSPPTGKLKHCTSNTECGQNRECRGGLCQQCPAMYHRSALLGNGKSNPAGCVADCGIWFTGSVTMKTENLCKKCDIATGELETLGKGAYCSNYGRCDDDGNCLLCDAWGKRAGQKKECSKCNEDSGAAVPDSSKEGKSCSKGRGLCKSGKCKCNSSKFFVEAQDGSCTCDSTKHRVEQDGSTVTCVCDSANGWTEKDGVCVCAKGYTPAADRVGCVPCPIGTYKDTVGVGSCIKCGSTSASPKNSTTQKAGSTAASACKCRPGYGKYDNKCEKCNGVWGTDTNIARLYSNTYNTAECSECGAGNRAKLDDDNNELYTGCTPCTADGSARCGCGGGKAADGKGGCTICWKGSTIDSNTICGSGKYCPYDIDHYPANRGYYTGVGEPEKYFCQVFHCKSGYRRTTTGCTKCSEGTYRQNVDNATSDYDKPTSSQCHPCPANSTTAGEGKTSKGDCVCNPGYGGNAGTTGCTQCTGNNYKDAAGNSACVACPSGKTVNSAHTSCYECTTNNDCSSVCPAGGTWDYNGKDRGDRSGPYPNVSDGVDSAFIWKTGDYCDTSTHRCYNTFDGNRGGDVVCSSGYSKSGSSECWCTKH